MPPKQRLLLRPQSPEGDLQSHLNPVQFLIIFAKIRNIYIPAHNFRKSSSGSENLNANSLDIFLTLGVGTVQTQIQSCFIFHQREP